MKKFIEPKIMLLKFDENVILTNSPTPSKPGEGTGETDFDITNP